MRRALIVILVLAAALAAAAAGVFYARLDRPFKGYAGEEQFVDVPPGTGVRGIAARLVESGVVADELSFRLAVALSGDATRLKAGEYRFDRALSPKAVVSILARGAVYLRPVTFPEGLTIREMARIYESRGLGTAADFEQAGADAAPIADLDPAARDLEGYLFPDTYGIPRGAPAAQLVRQMVRRFESVLTPALREEATARGFTVRQVVTLASLVEKETALPEERPTVAAVYLNRLRIGMGLQCDPTVIYALQRAGRWDGNLTREDLRFDSPYNTYRYAGLPPGPIAAPGRAAIEAVLRPAEVDYLYFVSRNDGSHVFASSLAEHNRNVRQWQVEYFRKQNRN